MKLEAVLELKNQQFLKAVQQSVKALEELAETTQGAADQALDDLTAGMDTAGVAAKLLEKNQDEVAKKVRAASLSYLEATAAAEEHKVALQLLSSAAPEVMDKIYSAGQAFDMLPPHVQAAAKSIVTFGELTAEATEKAAEASKKLDERLKEMGGKMQGWGQSLSQSVTAPLKELGSKALGLAGDFQQTLNVFAQNAGASGSQMGQVSAMARELGGDLTLPGTSANDAAAAMLELNKAGLSVKDTLAASKGTLQLAAAAGMDNARAAEIQANAMNVFSLSGDKANKVADLLAAASASASGEVTDIAEAMKQAGTVFASSGQSIEDTTTAIAMMAQKGIQGSDAGTSLKTMLSSLAAPSDEAKKKLKEMGIAAYDSQGKMLPMRDLVGTFSEKLSHMSQEQRNAALQTIFGSDAIRASQIVLGGGTKAWDKMSGSVTKTGAAADAAAAKNQGLKGALDGLNSAVESFLEGAAAPFLKVAEDVVRTAGKWLEGFSQMPEPVKTAGVVLAGLAAAAGPVLVVVGQLVTSFGAVSAAMPAVTSALGAVAAVFTGPLLGPILAVAAAVALLAVAWKNNLGGIREHVTKFVGIVGSQVQVAVTAVIGFLSGLGQQIAGWWQQLSPLIVPALTNLMNVIQRGLSPIVGFVKAAWGPLVEVVGTIWNTVTRVVRLGLDNAFGAIKAVLLILTGDWRGAWQTIIEIQQRNVEIVKTVLGGLGKAVWGLGKAVVQGLIGGIQSMAQNVVGAAKDLGNWVVKGFRSALQIHSPSKVAEKDGRNFVKGASNAIRDGAPEAGKAAETMGNHVITKFRGKMTEAQKVAKHEMALFQREMKAAQAKLSEALAGGDKEEQARAARLSKLTPAHRAAVDAKLDQLKQVNEKQKAKEQAKEGASRRDDEMKRLAARLAELHGDPIPVLKLEFPGLKPAELEKILAMRKAVAEEEAAQKSRDELHKSLMASSRSEAELYASKDEDAKTDADAETYKKREDQLDRLREGLAKVTFEQDLAAESSEQTRRAMELLGMEWDTASGEARSLAMILASQQLRWEAQQKAIEAGKQITGDYTKTLAALKEELALGTHATELQRMEYKWAQEDLSKLNDEDRKRVEGMRQEIKLLLQRKAAMQAASTHRAIGAGVRGVMGLGFLTKEFMEAIVAAKSFREEIDRQITAAKARILGVVDPIRTAFDEMRKSNEKLNDAIKRGVITEGEAFREFKRGFELNQEAETVEKLRERIEGNAFALRDAYGAVTTYDRILQQLGLTAEQVTPKIKEMIEEAAKQEDLIAVLGFVGQEFQSIFEDAFMSLKEGFDSFFETIITGFERMLQQMAAKYLASQLVQLITRAIGGFLGAGGNGGDGLNGFTGDINTGPPDVAFAAAGGPVGAGETFVVGEEGPEIFVPRRSGRIIPNHDLGMAGAGAMNITLNVHGVTDAGSFRRSEHQILQSLARGVDRARKR